MPFGKPVEGIYYLHVCTNCGNEFKSTLDQESSATCSPACHAARVVARKVRVDKSQTLDGKKQKRDIILNRLKSSER